MRLISLFLSILFLASCSHLSKNSKIQVPETKEFRLSNGLEVIYVENKKLPVSNIHLIFHPGASVDPKGKAGLTFLTAELLRKGTKTRSAEQVTDAFAQLGTSVGASVKKDMLSIGTNGLNYNQQELIELFAEVIQQPAFSVKEYKLLKNRMIASLQRKMDDPSFVASYVYERSLMGEHVYSRLTQGTLADIKAIRLQDIKDHYQQILNKNQMILLLTGDWSKDTIANLEKFFGKMKLNQKPPLKPVVATSFESGEAKVILATKPGLKQAQIRMGHKGIKRNNPDYWSLQVANVILGAGGMNSRLMHEVRVKKGLTYGVRSGFEPGLYQGPFSISTFTRFDKIGETLSTAKGVVELFRDKGVSKDEVLRAKNYLKGHLIRAFESPDDIVKTRLRHRIFGLPESELTDVIGKVNKVSVKSVNAAIKNYIKPEEFTQVIYAPEKYKSQLKDIKDFKIKSAASYF